MLRKTMSLSLPEQMKLEARMQDEAGKTADFAEGVTAFLEKRPAERSAVAKLRRGAARLGERVARPRRAEALGRPRPSQLSRPPSTVRTAPAVKSPAGEAR